MFRSFFLASILAALVFGTKKCGKNYCRNVDGDCEKGSTVNCKSNPCDTAKCAVGYYCSENYCNGCNAVCNSCVNPGQWPRVGCKDEEGCGAVNCKSNPCDTAKCAVGYYCSENYCNGC
eukprot:99105_1